MKAARRIWLLVLLAALLAAAGGLGYALLPYPTVKGMLDGLAPDGNFERLSRVAYDTTRAWALVGGSLSLLILLVFLFRRDLSRGWVASALAWLAARWASLRADAGRYWAQLAAARPRRGELWLLLAITLAGVILRALLLDRPMQHDEAYTFIAFASRGLRVIFTDYHLPNNHVFHSFLVSLSTGLFGEAPWAIRLPAYLAGVALIPASYAAGRLAFNRFAGLLAAALVAFSVYLINYSTDARGYTLMIFFGLSIWMLGMQLLRERNRFAWLLLTIAGALGFYTMPTMVYPYAAVMVWLALRPLAGDLNAAYAGKQFWQDLALSGLGTAAISLLLYLPIFMHWGFAGVFNHSIIAIMRDDTYADFFANLGARWGDSWAQWHEGLLPGLAALGVFGFAASLLAYRRLARGRAPLPLVGMAVIVAIMLAQRLVGWVRIWGFGLPFYLIFAAAGLVFLAGLFTRRLEGKWDQVLAAAAGAVFAAASLSWILRPGAAGDELRGGPGEVERATAFLSERVQPDDVIAVIDPDSPVFWYYAHQYGLPANIFEVQRQDLERVFVVLNKEWGQTVEQVVLVRSGLNDKVHLEEAERIYASRIIEIHWLPVDR